MDQNHIKSIESRTDDLQGLQYLFLSLSTTDDIDERLACMYGMIANILKDTISDFRDVIESYYSEQSQA